MGNGLLFSTDFETKLSSVSSDTKREWTDIGVQNYNELLEFVVNKLNEAYPKINIESYSFEDDVSVYGQSNTYFGVIKNDRETIVAYVFAIPPSYSTRSGVLAQQVFPVLSGVIPYLDPSSDVRITNKPIFIVNLNEANQTAAMALNIKSGEILGFSYIDIYDRDINNILFSNGLKPNIRCITDYDAVIAATNKTKTNEFFEIDEVNKKIKFLRTRLKDGIHVNNEPYWFVLKAYAALYLAKRDGYSCDMTEIQALGRGNKTLDAFRDFVEKVERQ